MLFLKHPLYTFSSAKDSKASLSLEASLTRFNQKRWVLMVQVTVLEHENVFPFLFSQYTLNQKKIHIKSIFQLIRTVELYKKSSKVT